MLKTIAMPIHRNDIRKSFAGFASRGYRGCEQDCMMDEMVKRLFKSSKTSSGHADTVIMDENDNYVGRVAFESLSYGSSPAYMYDDACYECNRGDLPKNADVIYRYITNKIGKLVQLTYDPQKVQLR